MGELSLLHALSNVPVYKCTPSVHLYTGTLERAWRRESSPRLVRIWLPWRRTTRRSESTQWREEKMKMRAKNTNLHIICSTRKYIFLKFQVLSVMQTYHIGKFYTDVILILDIIPKNTRLNLKSCKQCFDLYKFVLYMSMLF